MKENFIKLGYLNEDFHIFHIKDKKKMEFQYHSHDFHKIVMFISGDVTYHIEGKAYKLEPGDILLVGSTEIHKPQISPDRIYERIVLWVYPDFLEKNNTSNTNLLQCFQLAKERQQHLIRLEGDRNVVVMGILEKLEKTLSSNDYGNDVLARGQFLQLMVMINRLYPKVGNEYGINCYDEGISKIISFINSNIQEELSIDNIAGRFFMSRYSLMHKFKKETGSTVYDYIVRKRISMAKILIRKGMAISQIAQECGFGDYSSFERSFKKNLGMTPREYSSSPEMEFIDV